jgi:hypothetical protein
MTTNNIILVIPSPVLHPLPDTSPPFTDDSTKLADASNNSKPTWDTWEEYDSRPHLKTESSKYFYFLLTFLWTQKVIISDIIMSRILEH